MSAKAIDPAKLDLEEHRKQKNQQLKENEAFFGGLLIGVFCVGLYLLVWEVMHS